VSFFQESNLSVVLISFICSKKTFTFKQIGSKFLTPGMLINFFAVILVLVGLAISACKKQSCSPDVIRNTPEIKPSPYESEFSLRQAGEIQLPSGGEIAYKGVSFNYNPKIFGEVKVREVNEYALKNESDRPDSVAPERLIFTFDLLTDFTRTYIAIYPIEEFPRMYAVNKESMKAMQEEIRDFKKVLQNKNYRVKGKIPYLPFVDASQSFQVKVKNSKFKNGSGIFFLTHWSTEVALISNNHLRYIFEGLTSDGKYYVLAEMPARVDFLPEDSPEEFEGYKSSYLFEDYLHPNEIKPRYKKYISQITQRLENLPRDKYKPNLKYFEEIISSLKIENEVLGN
jgi:hypothetical protein